MSEKVRVLVLAEDYSDNNGKVSLHYIHTRNVEYLKEGIEVEVLSFSCNEEYILDGIRVMSLKTYEQELGKYDKLISHAPNLRNHYVFIRKHMNRFEKIIMFFHGHEVLRMSEAYPQPFDFVKKTTWVRSKLRDIYDSYKFKKWRRFISTNNSKLTLVFVSEWMLNQFLVNLKIDKNELEDYYIIHNSVGSFFERNRYDAEEEKEYDFITIRSSLDGSKYCIDVVHKLAHDNPEKKFLIIGKGNFFKYNQKSNNVTLLNRQLAHKEIIELLNKSKFALLPTRTDSQGVMACEMLTYGIPLITSSIPVCSEMFSEYKNVVFIDNDIPKLSIEPGFWEKAVAEPRTERFLTKNTVYKEIKIIKDGTL